jgi:protein-S-isoprenylcysteine O-methyltransferase
LISNLGSWFLLAGCLVLATFIGIEPLLRQTPSAKTFKTGRFDRRSSLFIQAGWGVGLWLPLILDLLGIAPFSIGLVEGVVALAFMVSGLALRMWAAVTLGRHYTRTLLVAEDQKVVSTGPYARIRHPGYTGCLLLWSGFGVLSSNLVLALLFPVVFVAIYLYRISAEERMLLEALGDAYARYQRRTRKLIPFVY